MKTRKIKAIRCNNELELAEIAQRMLLEEVRKHPGEKVTITIPLANGKTIQLFANPRIVPCYQA